MHRREFDATARHVRRPRAADPKEELGQLVVRREPGHRHGDTARRRFEGGKAQAAVLAWDDEERLPFVHRPAVMRFGELEVVGDPLRARDVRRQIGFEPVDTEDHRPDQSPHRLDDDVGAVPVEVGALADDVEDPERFVDSCDGRGARPVGHRDRHHRTVRQFDDRTPRRRPPPLVGLCLSGERRDVVPVELGIALDHRPASGIARPIREAPVVGGLHAEHDVDGAQPIADRVLGERVVTGVDRHAQDVLAVAGDIEGRVRVRHLHQQGGRHRHVVVEVARLDAKPARRLGACDETDPH